MGGVAVSVSRLVSSFASHLILRLPVWSLRSLSCSLSSFGLGIPKQELWRQSSGLEAGLGKTSALVGSNRRPHVQHEAHEQHKTTNIFVSHERPD